MILQEQKDFLYSFFISVAIVMLCSFFFVVGYNMSTSFHVTQVTHDVMIAVDKTCWNRSGVKEFTHAGKPTHAKVTITCGNGDVLVKWISLSQQEK